MSSIHILDNGRHVTDGVFFVAGHFETYKDKDETTVLTVDWSDWLGAATISASTWATDDNVTIDSESETATVATVTISGDPGGKSRLTNTLTASDGRVKQMTVNVHGRDS